MIIIWGTKNVRQFEGRRADYCPLCREIRPMRRVRLASVGHLYYVPLGRGTPLNSAEICEHCGLTHEILNEDQPTLLRSKRADLETLIEETNPDIRRRREADLTLAKRLQQRQATEGERRQAVYDVLYLANFVLDDQAANLRFDKLAAAALFLAIFAPILILACFAGTGRLTEWDLEMVAVLTAGVFGSATIFLLSTHTRRYARNRLTPILARSLAPLDPSEEEIQEVLVNLKSQSLRSGVELKARRLRDQIEREQSRADFRND